MGEKKSVILSRDLTEQLIGAANAWSIKNSALESMVACGLDLSTPTGTDYIDNVVAAATDYDLLVYKAADEAEEAGYDPEVDGPLKVHYKRGVAEWTPAAGMTDKPVVGFTADDGQPAGNDGGQMEA